MSKLQRFMYPTSLNPPPLPKGFKSHQSRSTTAPRVFSYRPPTYDLTLGAADGRTPAGLRPQETQRLRASVKPSPPHTHSQVTYPVNTLIPSPDIDTGVCVDNLTVYPSR